MGFLLVLVFVGSTARSCCKICSGSLSQPCGNHCISARDFCTSVEVFGCACTKSECCKLCTKGRPCGNSCIAAHMQCKMGVGCACWNTRVSGNAHRKTERTASGGTSRKTISEHASSYSGRGTWQRFWDMLPKGSLIHLMEDILGVIQHGEI